MKTTDFNKTVMKRIAKRVRGQEYDAVSEQSSQEYDLDLLTKEMVEALQPVVDSYFSMYSGRADEMSAADRTLSVAIRRAAHELGLDINAR